MPIIGLLIFVIMILAIVDIITRPDDEVKYLPKFVWLLVTILMPFIGTVLWFVLGRTYPDQLVRPARPVRMNPLARHRAEPEMPRRSESSERFDRRTTEQQLADLEREIEEEQLRAEIARRKSENGDKN